MFRARLFSGLLAALLLASACCVFGAEAEAPRIMLFTFYEQMGWGDRVEAGCVDDAGVLWTLSGSAAEICWRYGEEYEYLSGAALTPAGKLEGEALFDLAGMVECVQAQEGGPSPVAEDAGTEQSWAVRQDGTRVLLGMSGDEMFENMDPTAQALYLRLRELFPSVTCYGEGMGPAGFQPVSLAEFCGYDPETVRGAALRCADQDCEAGSIQRELSPEEEEEIRELAVAGRVTGKENCAMVTGGTRSFSFYDEADRCVASLEFYRGLLVRPDGMYRVER